MYQQMLTDFQVQSALLYFTHGFISGHITIYNRYYLLSLFETYSKLKNVLLYKQHKKWRIMNLKKSILKIVCDVISIK